MSCSTKKCSTSGGIIEKLKKSMSRKDEEFNPEVEEEVLSIFIDYLTPRMKYELKHVLKETEESRVQGIKALKELVEKEPRLKSRLDNNFLQQFLRSRKYDVKRAHKLLLNYYAFKKDYGHLFEDGIGNMKSVKGVVFRHYLGLLTKRDRNGSAIFIIKLAMWEPDIDVFADVFVAVSGILAYAIENSATQVTGFRIIFDIRDMTWKQMKYCTPENALMMVKSTQFCFPARYKGIHILTENKFFSLIWAIFYPFLTAKLKKRIHFHGQSLGELQKYIDPSVLPVEFGGQAEPFDNSSWDDIFDAETLKHKGYYQYGYE